MNREERLLRLEATLGDLEQRAAETDKQGARVLQQAAYVRGLLAGLTARRRS